MRKLNGKFFSDSEDGDFLKDQMLQGMEKVGL